MPRFDRDSFFFSMFMGMTGVRVPVLSRAAVVSVAAMAPMHEDMQQGAGQQDQPGQRAQGMGPVFGPQIKSHDGESGTCRQPKGGGMAAAIQSIHGNSLVLD